MSDNIISQINWDKTLDKALNGEQPPSVPIFPWHFADFVEHDPPLIDISVDLEGSDSSRCLYPGINAMCSSPRHRRRRKMSAPEVELTIEGEVIQKDDYE